MGQYPGCLDRTSLIKKGFNMWPKKMFNCGDIAENPERAGKIGLSCLLG